ncbi:MAG: type II toxin-antitoxin system PemK/MazF family toxin [Chloroflexi bacterium]|nr:type II toxin-antitoxin system PemK/MazF family toxin [Chloroflexota bacterium]
MTGSTALQQGDVVWAELPKRQPPGQEQHGRRPVVVVGLPQLHQQLPHRLVVVVPLTRTNLRGPLCPSLQAGAGGLPAESTALVHQVTAVDERRIVGSLGRLAGTEFEPIRQGLLKLFS